MAGKARLNKELIFGTILPAAGTVTGAAAVICAVGYVAWITHPMNNEEDPIPALHSHNEIPGDPGSYRLSGPDQIVTQQGDYKYTFNYEALQVIIEGSEKLEPIPFTAFSNPAMIDDMKGKACLLSRSFVTAANTYLAAEPREDRIQEYVNENRATAQAFVNDHCPIQRNIPHVR